MKRILTVAALAAFGAFGPLALAAPAYAESCTQAVNVCPTATSCSGAVDVCPMADPDDCAGYVDVCLDLVGP
jgi:hypothetical protein